MSYPQGKSALQTIQARILAARAKGRSSKLPKFIPTRAPLPIQASLAARSKRGLGVNTITRGIGDFYGDPDNIGDNDAYQQTSDYLSRRLRKYARPNTPAPAPELAATNHSDFEYGMGDFYGESSIGDFYGESSIGDFYGEADLGNWFTDLLNVGPKVYVPGVTQAPPLVHYNAWRDAVLKRGNTPARIPSGPNAGKWGERYVDQFGTARFANAPQTVWDEDVAVSAFNQQAADVTAAPGKILTTAAAIPRQVIGSALGIPQWLMPVLLLGGAAIAARQFLPKR